MNTEYDFLIIGGGSAGLTAAGFAVRLGLKVALVEKSRPGGDCTWTGCVPSKTLLRIARTAHEVRIAPQSGISTGPPKVDFAAVMSKVREVMEGIARAESAEALRSQGIDVFLGEAKFLDPHTIALPDAELKARRILIATGGKCSDLRGSEQPAAFQEGIETSSPPGAKEGCQGHLAVGALP